MTDTAAIERFNPDYDLVDVMDAHPFGQWVRFEDACALIERVETLEAEYARLLEFSNGSRSATNNVIDGLISENAKLREMALRATDEWEGFARSEYEGCSDFPALQKAVDEHRRRIMAIHEQNTAAALPG